MLLGKWTFSKKRAIAFEYNDGGNLWTAWGWVGCKIFSRRERSATNSYEHFKVNLNEWALLNMKNAIGNWKHGGTKRLNLLDGCFLPCFSLKFNVGGATKGKGRSGVLRLLLHGGNGTRNVVFPDLSELEILKKKNFGHSWEDKNFRNLLWRSIHYGVIRILLCCSCYI